MKPARRQTLTDSIYQQLVDAITSGAFQPGRKLVIDDLARQFQVSITPVREALKGLVNEGLVTEVPYSGIHVSRLSLDEMQDYLTLRGVLDGYSALMAVGKLNEADWVALESEIQQMDQATTHVNLSVFRRHNLNFHLIIANRSCNHLLPEYITQAENNVQRYLFADSLQNGNDLLINQQDHRNLLSLLREGKGGEAEQLCRDHTVNYFNRICNRLEIILNQLNMVTQETKIPELL